MSCTQSYVILSAQSYRFFSSWTTHHTTTKHRDSNLVSKGTVTKQIDLKFYLLSWQDCNCFKLLSDTKYPMHLCKLRWGSREQVLHTFQVGCKSPGLVLELSSNFIILGFSNTATQSATSDTAASPLCLVLPHRRLIQSHHRLSNVIFKSLVIVVCQSSLSLTNPGHFTLASIRILTPPLKRCPRPLKWTNN